MESFIEQTLASHPVVIFGKTGCKYCGMLKDLLEENGISFHLENLQKEPRSFVMKAEAMAALSDGNLTFPQLFVDKTYVGDYQNVKKMFLYDTSRAEALFRVSLRESDF